MKLPETLPEYAWFLAKVSIISLFISISVVMFSENGVWNYKSMSASSEPRKKSKNKLESKTAKKHYDSEFPIGRMLQDDNR